MNSLLFVSVLTWPTKLSALRLVRGSVQFDNKDNEEILKVNKQKVLKDPRNLKARNWKRKNNNNNIQQLL